MSCEKTTTSIVSRKGHKYHSIHSDRCSIRLSTKEHASIISQRSENSVLLIVREWQLLLLCDAHNQGARDLCITEVKIESQHEFGVVQGSVEIDFQLLFLHCQCWTNTNQRSGKFV